MCIFSGDSYPRKKRWFEIKTEKSGSGLKGIRSKWSGSAPSPEHPDCSPDRMEQGAVVSPGLPGSPAGSSSGSESGREEKRRRLDLLLNKKFEKVKGNMKKTWALIKTDINF